MTEVAVVILNWNGSKFLRQFLPSVIEHSGTASIYVADNGSSDDSVSVLEKEFPSVKIIQTGENYGFSKGYNVALKQVDATYYVLLNSDIEVTPGWTEAPIALLKRDAKIAACQPKIRAFYDKEMFEHAGAAGGFIDKWGYPFCRGRLFDLAEKDTGQYDNETEIFWATGACLFIKSELYHSIGGLDDDFFAHMEEIDMCWRLKNAGYSLYYCPDSLIYHVGGGTLNKTSPRKTYLNFRNGMALLYKNLPFGRVVLIMVWRLILDGVAGIAFLANGKGAHMIAVLKAHIDFYRMMPKWRKGRKHAQSLAIKHDHPEIFHKSIVWKFFIKKKQKFSELTSFKHD